MTDPASVGGGPPALHDALNGWKDIASYLGKSVRSVQRWEQQLGLPVHRINTPKGQIIYAVRQEIDAWRARMDNQGNGSALENSGVSTDDEAGAPEDAAPGNPPAVVSGVQSTKSRSGWWIAASILCAVAAIALIFLLRPGRPVEFVISAPNVEGRDSAGRVAWSYPLGPDARRAGGFFHRSPESSDTVEHVDLTGDGNLDILLAVGFGLTQNSSRSTEELYAFTEDGHMLWRVADLPNWSCVDKSFEGEGPWRIMSVLVSGGTGPKRVWVSYVHDWSWPSFVVEIKPDGTQRVIYLQTGWITSLREWATPEGMRIVAGGTLGGYDRPSVAVLDPDGPTATSPYENPKYECKGAPAGHPSRLILFPNLDVVLTNNKYSLVHSMDAIGPNLKVDLDDGNVLAVVGSDGAVRTLTPSDTFAVKHRKLEESHSLTHSADACPELTKLHEIRTWTPAQGWQISKLAFGQR